MEARVRWIIAGVVGVAMMAIALAMAWSFLMPVGDLTGYRSDRIAFDIVAAETGGSYRSVLVDHHVEAEWEYVTIALTGADSAKVHLRLTEGNVRGDADWYCGSGVQAAAGGSPASYRSLRDGVELVITAGESYSLSEALQAEGVAFKRATMTSNAIGISCQRIGTTFERRSQGLVLLASSSIWASLEHQVQANLSQSLELPLGWEIAGRVKQVSTREHFGGSSARDPSDRYIFVSSPERASQTESADQIDGVQLVRDSAAASDEATGP
ncbi:hypothetical protein [Microbacterium sp.]|uniref:hypothetical protein n=1 Tax=Microbacterium sp. TaxID=51671 RepID=UPI0039E380D8